MRALRSFSAQSARRWTNALIWARLALSNLGAAEVDGVGLHKLGIELVLTDELAQTVADTQTCSPDIAVGWLR
jgi:hypothetical protein